ncbi:MAG: hypothetical protein GC192_16315 [Bacteroidetes bacterium]|nr:hypothetical protein [Bacteroidota bacterium]
MLFKILSASAISIFLFVISIVGLQTHLGLEIKYLIASVPFGDKAIHFCLMVMLSFFLFHAVPHRRLNILGHGLLISSLLLAVGITLEEFSQIFIPSRNFEIMDMVCNYAGIYLGTHLAKLLDQKHLSDADDLRRETLSIQTIRHSAGPLHHESGNGRRTARRMVRHHGRR